MSGYVEEVTPQRRPASRLLRRYLHNRLAVVGVGIILLIVVAAIFAPLIAPADPLAENVGERLAMPSAHHLLGTDELGRDLLSRVIYGSRVSLEVCSGAVAFSLLVGGAIGIVAGYFRGTVETVIMFGIDIMLALPGLILTIIFVVIFGAGVLNLILAIGIGGVPTFARLAHAPTLSMRRRDFVQHCEATGAGAIWIMRRHIWPNIRAEILVLAALNMGTAILIEAGLSFIGIGVPPPTPTWGQTINSGMTYLGVNVWYALGPGLCIFLAVMGFNLVGDGLRDILDPKSARSTGVG